MGIKAHAAGLINRITTNLNGFATAITFDNGSIQVVCGGNDIRHHLKGMSLDNTPVDGLTARISVSESALAALSYPVRNGANEVNMLWHKVTYTDVSGITRTYVINQQIPGDTVGLLVFVLGTIKIV